MSLTDVRAVIPYVFCADAGAIADWCVQVLGLAERRRWSDDEGVVRNVELVVGGNEVWLDGPVPDWQERLSGLGSWVGFLVDDVDAVYGRITEAGASVEPPIDREFGVRQITVTDPEGHMWGFIRRADATHGSEVHPNR